jgi:hypothetical protein
MIKGARILLAGLFVAGFCSRASAAATVTISDGNPLDNVVVTDNGAGDTMSALGAVYVRTNIGVWYLSISSAITKPLFGSATQPVMDLLIQANSSAAGNLTFTFSDNNFGPATGTLTSKADGHLVDGGAPTTLSYDVFGDPGNTVYAGGPLPPGLPITHIAPTPMPLFSTDSGLLLLPAPFSLTQVITFSAAGATGFSADGSFSFTPVPEPSLIGLGSLGLIALSSRLFRRK